MGSIAKFRKKQVGILAAAVMATAYMPTAFALPTGEHNIQNVKVGADGKIPVDGDTMTVELDKAKGAIDWE